MHPADQHPQGLGAEFRRVYANGAGPNLPLGNRVISSHYTVWTFVPLALALQFAQFPNRYFLLVACLQLAPQLTPVNPLTTWLPLLVVLAVSAAKEGLDDYQRHVQDREFNSRSVTVLKGGTNVEVQSSDVQVGDMVLLQGGSEVPCDLLLLATSNADGGCYLETSNLDGESDLKPRAAPAATQQLGLQGLASFQGCVDCSEPDGNFYHLQATMHPMATAEADPVGLDASALLLQGAAVRGAEWVAGLAIYTGPQTKLGMNRVDGRPKTTQLDARVAHLSAALFTAQFVTATLLGLLGLGWWASRAPTHTYLGRSDGLGWGAFLVYPLRMLLLMSVVIPISLKVTLDVVKYYLACLVDWDNDMVDPATGMHAQATSTALGDELGHVQCVVADKTGTLTTNTMRLHSCSLQGTTLQCSEAMQWGGHGPTWDLFVLALALCNTIVPRFAGDETEYEGQSPDEEALVLAAARAGCRLMERAGDVAVVQQGPDHVSYRQLQLCPFTSDRRRQSVVLLVPGTEGRVLLLCKGADEVLLPRCKEANPEDTAQLLAFAQAGLRTLCVCCRWLDGEAFARWQAQLRQAQAAMHSREVLLEECYGRLEQGMQLLGITAIEDTLQDGVGQTVEALRQAGIRLWLATGDKAHTAQVVATRCRMLIGGPVAHIHGGDTQAVGQALAQADPKGSIVIDGAALAVALSEHSEVFGLLAWQAEGLVACRVSPGQKAMLVDLARQRGARVLAVGDGGNDVGMIQAAHVGVAVRGKEGMQAVRAADYAIGRFRDLGRLLLVHGRLGYRRTAFVVLYSFHKALFIVTIQLAYQAVCGASGASLLGSVALAAYNVLFTCLPVVFYVCDQDIPPDLAMAQPELYRETASGRFCSTRRFVLWQLLGVYQGLATLCCALAVFGSQSSAGTGQTAGHTHVAVVAYAAGIVVQTLNVGLATHSFALPNSLALALALPSVFLLAAAAALCPTVFPEFAGVLELYRLPGFWATCLLAVGLSCLPPAAIMLAQPILWPLPSQVARQRWLTAQHTEGEGQPLLSAIGRPAGR